MKQIIWKYPFQIEDRFEIEMPEGAQVLTAQMQGSTPCLWALVNPEAPKTIRKFFVYGTGHEIGEEGIAYIGSVQSNGFVWHVFF